MQKRVADETRACEVAALMGNPSWISDTLVRLARQKASLNASTILTLGGGDRYMGYKPIRQAAR